MSCVRGWQRVLPAFLVSVVILIVGVAARAATLFEFGANWRWLKGTREASSPDTTAWRGRGFDDAAWALGPAPFSYGEGLAGTALDDMRGGYTCVYLRRTFVVPEPSALSKVRLLAWSDDGFVAWINGQPVARFNVPDGEIPFRGTASGTFNEPLPIEAYEIDDPARFLVPGTNVIAVQAFNASLSGSSDFVFQAALEAEVDDLPPRVSGSVPPAGARVRELSRITVQFDEPVEGVDAVDLLINGSPATNLTGFAGDQYVFEFSPVAPGPVTVRWAAGAGIRDRSPLANAFVGGSWTYTVDPNLPPPGLILSEFMADNDRTLNDEDGEASDWIEIANTSDESANLSGWGLTDSAADPLRWRFPAVAIPGRGFLVVFASGKNRTNAAGRLHTSFRLGREGGYLALTRPDGSVASGFAPAYPAQREDVSYGRLATDPLKAGYFAEPTPGAANAEGGDGFAPEVAFSRIGGTFLAPFNLTLSAEGTGVTVRYTTDGRVPTEDSPAYSAPLRIGTSMRVRARAFAEGLLPGPLVAEDYVQLNPTAASATSSLPLVILHSFGGGAVPPNGEYPASVSIYEPRGGASSLTNAPDLRTRAKVNIRGSSTLFQPKRNYSVEFRDEREADRDLSPLGLPADSDWILYAPNNFEPILIHNPFIYRLSNEIGRYAPRTRFVELYVQTDNGPVSSASYAGIYVLMEKIKRGADRIDVANLEPEHVVPPRVTGGYILKIDRLDPGDSGMSAGGQQIGFVEPKEEEMELPQRAPQRSYIQSYLNQFNQALTGTAWQDPVRGWRAYVDPGSWIDHHLLNVMAFNVDALRLSAYFYKPREGRLEFGPIWDFDRALNSTDGRDANPRVWRSAVSDRGTDFFNYPWWGRLFRDPDFWQAWIDRYQELRRAQFHTNHLFAVIDEMTGQLRAAQPREAARWPGFTSPRTSYQNEINILKTWLTRRLDFMDTNFLAPPTLTLSTNPGAAGPRRRVQLAGPTGATVFFTLDGSDPRAPGGGTAASATAYTVPVDLPVGALLKARSFNANHRNLTGPDNPPISSPWSGVVETRATTAPGAGPRRLRFVEIHARPAAPTSEERAVNPAWSAGDFEFLELANPGTEPVVLGDLRFDRGISFAFATSSVPVLAPRSRLVLVRNRAAFERRYGSVAGFAGEYRGSLSGTGEALRLVDGTGTTVAEARYELGPFPTADGLGFSLVRRGEDTDGEVGNDPDQGTSSWRPSVAPGGSPGRPDGDPVPVPEVRVNEALTHTDPPQLDGIELWNPGAMPADIGGWYLTDDRAKPVAFRIPDGTILPAGGYLWIDESRFHADPSAPASFRLDSTGDQVWLFAADASGRLHGYAHGFDFGAAENGVSFGRESTCAGDELFLPQFAATPGAPNAGPRPPSLLITEVHYHPPDIVTGPESWNDSSLEYVEVANVTANPVPLFDPVHPTNRWRLKDAVGYTFPPGVVLPARGLALVVNFDPNNNPQALARFRAVYRPPADVPLFGPYSGSLPNGSGRVELARPDTPQQPPAPDAGFVPYLVVDRVAYADESPWTPLADGTGRSLTRVRFDGPGSEPRSWVATNPSPGTLPSSEADTDGDSMADRWEAAYCLDASDPLDANLDPDADGARNLEEWLAHTDPQDPADVLAWVSAGIDDTGRTRLSFVAKAGVSYVIEVTDALAPGGWRKLQEVPTHTADRVVTIEELAGGGARFYRIGIP